MRTYICILICILMLLFSAVVFAQDDFGIPAVIPKELLYSCNSAPPPTDTISFNADVIDTANPSHDHPVLPLTYKRIFISTDGQSSWSDYEATLIGATGYENTYEYDYVLPLSSGTFHYYFQIGTDSTVTSQAPKNSTGTFPPPNNLMANIQDDPAGDDLPVVLESTYNWDNTDLRNFKIGYSDTKIFVQMTSNGGFSTSHNNLKQFECGFFDKFVDVYHLYAVPIVNPQAPYPDSIFYAVLYGDLDISFLAIGITITPGVYKIVSPGEGAGIIDYLDAYTKISDGTNYGDSISGDVLNMWFSTSLLTADPDFGPFPDDNGFMTGCGIASAYICYKSCSSLLPDTFAYVVHDFSRNTGFYMTTLQDVVNENTAFSLSSPSSDATKTQIQISISYDDDDNNLPTNHRVEIGGCYEATYDMYAYDHTYDDISIFEVDIPMANPYFVPFRFHFSDGMHTYTSDWDTVPGIEAFEFSINGLDSIGIHLDIIECNDTVVLAALDSISLRNEGSVPIDYGLRIASISDGVRTFSVAGESDVNVFAVRAIFDDASVPPPGYMFDNPENYAGESLIWADGTVLGGGGINILPPCYYGGLPSYDENNEKLWLKFIAPTYVTDAAGDINITMDIELCSRIHMP